MAIIDHDEMMAERAAEKTMALRVTPEGEYRAPSQRPETFHQSRRRFQWAGPFPVRRAESMTGRLSISKPPLADVPSKTLVEWGEEKRRRAVEQFAKEASIEDVVEAVALLDDAEGVEEESDDSTSTFALPAVWKMTGKPSTNKLAHRSAAHVQRIFNEAGWPITVWFGETTREYWVMDEYGIHSFESITAMYQGMGWESL